MFQVEQHKGTFVPCTRSIAKPTVVEREDMNYTEHCDPAANQARQTTGVLQEEILGPRRVWKADEQMRDSSGVSDARVSATVQNGQIHRLASLAHGKPFQKQRPSARGFTMIEMLITLSVGLVLAAVSVPVISSTLAFLRLNAAVASITGAISATRFQAIMHGYPYTVAFDPTTLSYQIADSTVSPFATFTNVGNPVPLSSSGGVVIGTATTLEFKPNGIVQPTLGAMSFTVTYAGRTKTITVSGVGRVQVQ